MRSRHPYSIESLIVAFCICSLSGTTRCHAADVPAVEGKLLDKVEKNIEQHRKADAVIQFTTAEGRPIKNAPVEVTQVGHEFLFGCIIFDLVWTRDPYRPELYKRRFKDLFNFAVFPFYWGRYEPQQGTTMQAKTLDVVKWCRANGITTKGHPLVWTNPSGVPKWLKEHPAERTEQLLLDRVKREASGFAGRIDIWDVVNEPVNVRTWDHAGVADYIREPVEKIADYVEKAFKAAHQANPKAHLILNEYNTIARKDVRDRFCQLVLELKRRKTPISGLGIQAHEPREHWYPPQEVWATFDRLASLGYPLHITEFIPQSGGKDITGGWRKGTWTEDTQADFAEQFYKLSFGHPAVVSINWWGLSDRRIWLPGGGLIDAEYEPKKVYERLRRLVHEDWTTRIDATTDEKGTVAFRGFYGKYSITVKVKEREARCFDAALCKDRPNRWVFVADD
jgi:endo-1,4-beta-xylanase